MSGSGSSSGSMQRKFRGVRQKKWGKWVTEVTEPGTKRRVWLGSFKTAEAAAHAYDAGLMCVRGSTSKLNFPNDKPTLPPGTPGNYSLREIQGAAQMAAAESVGRCFSFRDWMRSQSPTGDSDPEDNAPPDVDDTTPDPPSSPITPAFSSPYPDSPFGPPSDIPLWRWS